MQGDFAYIEDVVEVIMRVLEHPPKRSVLQESVGAIHSNARYKIYNLGNHQPVDLLRFIEVIEQALGIEARRTFLPMQPGDVVSPYAQMDDLYEPTGFRPPTPIEEGLPTLVQWHPESYSTTAQFPSL